MFRPKFSRRTRLVAARRRASGTSALAGVLLGAALLGVVPRSVRAQTKGSAGSVGSPDAADSLVDPTIGPGYWPRFATGFGVSLLAHEAGHILMSVALGAHPSFGFNELRPTIYSGISAEQEPHKQFLFSSAGLFVQSIIDEAVLDVPHARGSAFERGILGGGIGTTLFYLTIGRTGSVSDIEFIARTHGMTKTQATFLFGGIAGVQAFRISRDKHYANFFARPQPGGADFGVNAELP